jgi:hypothetical protein
MEFLLEAANRGSVSTTYSVDNSCVFNNVFNSGTVADSMVRETGTPSDQTRWTLSCWAKVGDPGNTGTMNLGGANTGTPERSSIQISSGQLIWIDYPYSSFGGHNLVTNRVFRDTSAWYHLVFVYNSNEGTQANRVKIYVNGVQETSFATNSVSIDSAEVSAYWNHGDYEHFHGRDAYGKGWDGYLADIFFLDGQVKAASDFGETDEDSGIWKPKAYSGSFGNNGYHLDFESSGSMGADVSGNSNNFTLTGIDSSNQATDTPTNNFCTWNPLNTGTSGSDTWGITEGSTELTYASSGWNHFFGTIPVTNGKWYWEAEYQVMAYSVMGWHDVDAIISGEPTTGMGGFVNYNGGEMRVDNSETTADYGTVVNSSIIGVALNMDDNQVTIYIDNSAAVSNYSIGNSANKYVVPFVRLSASAAASCSTNFGGYTAATISSAASDGNGYGTFEYAPPSGYYALCTKNLAEFG